MLFAIGGLEYRVRGLSPVGLDFCLGYFVVKKLNERFNKAVHETTLYPTTTATVKNKEYVQFDQKNHVYINDLGDKVEKQPGEERWRAIMSLITSTRLRNQGGVSFCKAKESVQLKSALALRTRE
jgi:hypothetical protein